MDDAEFLESVGALVPDLVPEDVVVTAVGAVADRPWLRAEVTFRIEAPAGYRGPTQGVAHLPVSREWRIASCLEEPRDYACRLAAEVEVEARRLPLARVPQPPPAPEQVTERWGWLIDRLELSGRVRSDGHDRLVVTKDDGADFTVIVTPEEWARIGAPFDPDSDDPQDFNQIEEEETYLVFYEDDLVWSVRPELPPVGADAMVRRRVLDAQTQGRGDFGWYALPPGDDGGHPSGGALD